MAKPHNHANHYNAHCWSWARYVHGCDYLSNFRMKMLFNEEKIKLSISNNLKK